MSRAAGVVVAVAIFGASVAAPTLAQHADLSGRWAFNPVQSDNPRDMIRPGDSTPGAARGGRGHDGGVGAGGGLGDGFEGGQGGVPSWRGGPEMTDDDRARMRETMHLAIDAPHALTISVTDSAVTLAPDSGEPVVLHPDGRKRKQKVRQGGDIETKTRWADGGDLVVERQVSGGGKVVEDYLRAQDGTQLYVIVAYTDWNGRSVEFRRVYDLALAAPH